MRHLYTVDPFTPLVYDGVPATRPPAGLKRGPHDQLIIGDQGGKNYIDTVDGRTFSQASTPLGLAIPIYTATAIAGGLPLRNIAGSNVNVEIVDVSLAYGSGTAAYGAIGLMVRSEVAAAWSAFANTTPQNGIAFGGRASKTLSSNAGTCTAAAGVAADWFRTLASMNLEAQTGTAHGLLTAKYEFNGSLILPPGTCAYLAATLASVALIASSITWIEHPIVT